MRKFFHRSRQPEEEREHTHIYVRRRGECANRGEDENGVGEGVPFQPLRDDAAALLSFQVLGLAVCG